MNQRNSAFRELKGFLILLVTQSFSALGSAMTSFALILWSYQQAGSALATAMLSVCSYVPYVVMSIFAGALSDRLNKKATMLVCDSAAALSTVAVLALYQAGGLKIGHLYAINALNGLMNTVQRPAADVTVTLLTPEHQYQRAGALQSLANALVNMLSPVLASALMAALGLRAVIAIDLTTFAAAFLALLLFVRIPEMECTRREEESVLAAARAGMRYLRAHRGVMDLMLFLAAVNLCASVYSAALPARILPVPGGGEAALGIINTVAGLAMLAGSVAASVLPAPRSRVRVICNALLLSLGTENILLALGHTLPVWCVGAVLGWIAVPLMNANMDALLRSTIPVGIQGRVFSVRNTLQFFTIPVGNFLGGWLVDAVFEPAMAAWAGVPWLSRLFGSGKGSGAAALFLVIAVYGVAVCVIFRRDGRIWALERRDAGHGTNA